MELKFILESLLFSAQKPMSIRELREVLVNAATGEDAADVAKPLKKVKGRFDTYDVRGLVADLEAFAAGKEVAFPVYSRKLHDPVKNSIHVTTAETLLVVEGLWLLHDAAGWEAVRPLLDFSFFIESDVERTKAPVIRRHMTGGRTLADATRHYEEVDARNSALVLLTKSKADKVIPPYYAI